MFWPQICFPTPHPLLPVYNEQKSRLGNTAQKGSKEQAELIHDCGDDSGSNNASLCLPYNRAVSYHLLYSFKQLTH